MSAHLDVFNPQALPVEDLPTIYGFNNGSAMGGHFHQALALAEDGTVLGSHLCSSEGFMPGDLGLTPTSRREDRKEHYRSHYPNGYRTEFVAYEDVDEHVKLRAAIEKGESLALAQAEQETDR